MIRKFTKALLKAGRNQRGMTGLETAIILIAFVTVAAVFGYAVLSAGIFSAEKGKETVYAGLEQAKSSMELKGSVIAYGAPGDEGMINNCDDSVDWTGSLGVTAAQAVGYGGGHSVMLTLDHTTFSAGLIAYASSNTSDLTGKSFVNLYVMADNDMATGDLKLLLSTVADCTSPPPPLETLDLPAITAGTWTLVTLNLANPAADTGILTVGLQGPSLTSDVILYVDNIVSGPPYNNAELVVFTMANAVAGKPIDLTPTPNNVTVISYTDRNRYEANVNWTVSFVGNNDGDYLLETGEQAQIAVSLGFLATPLGSNSGFGLQVKPPHGSVTTIERTIPANIDAVMDLY